MQADIDCRDLAAAGAVDQPGRVSASTPGREERDEYDDAKAMESAHATTLVRPQTWASLAASNARQPACACVRERTLRGGSRALKGLLRRCSVGGFYPDRRGGGNGCGAHSR